MIHNETPKVDWNYLLDYHEFLSIQAVRAGNFDFVANVAALHSVDLVDHRKVVAQIAGSDDPNNQLDDVNIASANSVQQSMADYKAVVEDPKNKDLDQAGWEKLLDDQQQKSIDFATAQIKGATTKAKEIIGSLPPESRTSAAQTYNQGSNIVMQAFSVLGDQIGKLADYIVDFLKGVWEAVENAWGTVKGAVSSAISFIKGLFLLSASSSTEMTVQKKCTSCGMNGSSNNGEALFPTRFVGKLNWPAAVTFGTAVLGLGYVTQYVVNNGITITSQQITKDGTTGAETVVTETVIVSKDSKTNLEMVWQRATNELGDDGHYVPPQ